jgi:hypothetical protein
MGMGLKFTLYFGKVFAGSQVGGYWMDAPPGRVYASAKDEERADVERELRAP